MDVFYLLNCEVIMKIHYVIIIFLLTLMFCGCHKKELILGPHEVHVGHSLLLDLSVSIDGEYYWESSNNEIATVEYGEVYGITTGEVIISIIQNDNVLATHLITVLASSTLIISGNDFVLIGESTLLSVASSMDNDAFLWESSDENIATVSNGLVFGVSEGTVEIQVSSSHFGLTFIVFHVITDQIPDHIDIINALDTYTIEEGPYYLEAVAYPHYASQNFYWEVTGSKAIIDKDSGLITFLNEGTIYVTCRSVLSDYVFKVIALTAKHHPDVEVTRILFIGNSLTYVNDIPKMVQKMVVSSGKLVYCDSITEGGANIYGLYNSNYQTIINLMESKEYDYIVLQEQSSGSYSQYERFINGVSSFKTLADLYNIDILLYQTWPYKDGSVYLLQQQMSQIEMLNAIVDAYNTVGNEFGAFVHPVGEIFYAFLQAYPGIDLYMDDNHASLAGSYLASCVHYVEIFGESVIGNGYQVALDDTVKEAIQTFVTNYLLIN